VAGTGFGAVGADHVARSTCNTDGAARSWDQRERIADCNALGHRLADTIHNTDGIALSLGDLIDNTGADPGVDAGSVAELAPGEHPKAAELHPRHGDAQRYEQELNRNGGGEGTAGLDGGQRFAHQERDGE
jgi:hypothetical protein